VFSQEASGSLLRSASFVTVMQAADFRNCDNLTLDLRGSGIRRILAQRKMQPGAMVIGAVFTKRSPERFLVEHDDVIEALATDRSDHALAIAILPGRPRRAGNLVDVHRVDLIAEVGTKDTVAVADQILRCAFEGKRFDDLPSGPSSGWMSRHVEVNDPTAIMAKDHEDVQQLKRHSRDREEIDRG